MLSIFYKIFELETPQGVSVDIFKPNKEKQIILMKGKLGQYKLNWSCCSHTKGSIWLKIEEKLKEINNENKKQEDITNLLKGSIIWTLENEQENNAAEEKKKKEETNCSLDLRKENKRFIYDQKKNKINEYTYIKTTKNVGPLKNNTALARAKNNNIQKKENIKNNEENINEKEKTQIAQLQMGYIIPFKKRDLLNQNEKIKENEINNIFKKETLEYLYQVETKNILKQIKNIIKGINQGFSINLELKGIGYTAKITENIINKNEKKNQREAQNNKDLTNNIGQLESNINLSNQKYEKNNTANGKKNKINKKYIILTEKIEKKQENKGDTGNKLINETNKNKEAKLLTLRLGTSHNINYPLYKHEITIKILTLQNNFVTLSLFGISQEILKNVAAEIYLIKKPEPYKGKGIRYDGEKFFSKEKTKKS